MKVIIIFNNKKIMLPVNDLLFNGNTMLHSDKVTITPGVTTLEDVKCDIDTRQLIYGCLTSVSVISASCPEISKIFLVTGNRKEAVWDEGLCQYQYMTFAGKTITKHGYQVIEKEVHRIDRRNRFINILMNIDCDDNTFQKKVEYLLENAEDEFVEFVDDKLLEIVTKTDEENIIRELLDTYSDKINCDR